MATLQSFEELDVWQNARKFVGEVYQASGNGALSRDFGLRDQLRRASVSIISNIAEGFERAGNREFIHFLYLAKRSAGEVRTQIYLALDLKYLTKDEFQRLNSAVVILARQISALIKYLENAQPTVVRHKPSQPSNLQTFKL